MPIACPTASVRAYVPRRSRRLRIRLVKKLAAALFAVALIAAAPREAAADRPLSLSIGSIFPTILGATTGGAIGYYFVTGPVAITTGAVLGGLVGNWWYTTGTAPKPAASNKKKSFYSEIPPLPFQLIRNDGGRGAGLRPAAFSAASD